MKQGQQTRRGRTRFLLSAILMLAVTQSWAQSLQLSKRADFSTTDGIFSFSDSLHARVVAPDLNYLDLKKNEFELKTLNSLYSTKGAFINNLTGTYEAHIPLSALNRTETAWEFRAELEDKQGARFETRVNITIQVSGASDTLALLGRIDSLGTNFFRISNTTFFVDTQTRITENGQIKPFSILMNNWKVNVVAAQRADNRYWALAIDIIERSSEFEIETKGIIASIQNNVVTVNNIHFIVSNATELLDRNNNLTTLASFKVGMLAEAKGMRQANGEISATRLKIEDDVIGGDEIEFTGKITAIRVDSSAAGLKLYVSVEATLFEVNNQTAILGFDNEPISFFDLRVGEIVEIKGQTRSGNLPVLAVRIKREDRNGGTDVEFKGVITGLQDSTVFVNDLAVRVVRSTVILDNNNNFIPLSALRTGLLVEVHANISTDSSFLATRIKVEDNDNDEVELRGFIDALTSNTITVLGVKFSVNDSTIVRDNLNNIISFSALQVGMLVEIRGERLLDGAILATNIKREDFGNDEIELRGLISALGADNLTVSGVTFYVTNATVILDRNNVSIPFSQLANGMIVEVRADLQSGRWVATKIHIEDGIDRIVEIRGRIERLLPAGFLMLGREIRVTNTTIFLNEQNQPITLADLRVNDFVEVRAQMLSDSILVALRVKREDNSTSEIEFTGSINVLSFTTVTVGNIIVRVDGATVYLDHNNQPIKITDLHLGMVVEVKALRQAEGSLLATRVKAEQRLALNGVISQVLGSQISIQGLPVQLTSGTTLFDQQNRPVTAQALRANQLVDLVAQTVQGQSQVVTLRIVFSAPTNVATAPSVNAPREFVLSQNYPNPFNPSTVIRFLLPQTSHATLAVYDVLGHRVRTLVDGVQTAGEQRVTWDGRDDRGAAVASGMYFYRLSANGLTQTRKLTLMR